MSDEVCSQCKTSPYPRGYCANLGLCWFCVTSRLSDAGMLAAREVVKSLRWAKEQLA